MQVHFIAIGGSVMHQLALALLSKGYKVTGSDDEIFEPAKSNLERAGLLAENGWNPAQIHERLDAVILGMHAKADNPELQRAVELGLKIYSFPEYIFQESRDKQRIVVGGSHGKTSTTAMIMHVLRHSGRQFDYLVGARLDGFERSVQISDASLIVCEGDEYPASAIEKRPKFHFLYPHTAIITGIAWDHINVFPTFDNYLEQFRIFIDKIEPGGLLIYNDTDTECVRLVNDRRRSDIRYQPYGIPQHSIEKGKTTITIGGNSSEIRVFGDHNLLNLHAAYFACREAGITAEQFTRTMQDFKGAAKRLEVMAENGSTVVYRDFAHAPSKLVATIQAVRRQFPGRKLIAVFELHTYSSLNEKFLSEYSGTMDEADNAAVIYSKHALEIKRLPDLDPEKIKNGFKRKDLQVFNDKDEFMKWLASFSYDNANLLLMSSGNFDGVDMLTFAKEVTA
jgi:UDP-N-acetylmuramate: L-alanyl-gamma-D-glutamyl-meso-diaminopimelate ligase